KAQRAIKVNIPTLPRERLMLLHLKAHKQITMPPVGTTRRSLTLATDPHLHPVVHTRWNVESHCRFLRHMTRTAARRTRLLHHGSRAAALVTRRLHREETPLQP